MLLLLSWKRIRNFSSERIGLRKSKKEKERLIDQKLQVCSSADNDFVFTSEPMPLFCPILLHYYTLSLILTLLCCKTTWTPSKRTGHQIEMPRKLKVIVFAYLLFYCLPEGCFTLKEVWTCLCLQVCRLGRCCSRAARSCDTKSGLGSEVPCPTTAFSTHSPGPTWQPRIIEP